MGSQKSEDRIQNEEIKGKLSQGSLFFSEGTEGTGTLETIGTLATEVTEGTEVIKIVDMSYMD